MLCCAKLCKLKLQEIFAINGNFMLKKLRKKGYGSFVPLFPGVRIIPLHVMLSGCGYSLENSPSYRWDGMKRGKNEFCIFQYTLSGRGALIFEGKIIELSPNKAFLVHVPHEHIYLLPDNSSGWEFIYFSLVGREALSLWLTIEHSCGPVVEIRNDAKIIKRLFEIYCAGKEKIQNPYQASALAYELIMLLCEEILPASHSNIESELLKKVLDFCVDNIASDIGVEDMAKVAGLSRFHFSRVFKMTQGMSPAFFLTNLRMKRALNLIQNERLSVKEIAAICGYNDASYFCKVFKKFFKTSPEKFRSGHISLS